MGGVRDEELNMSDKLECKRKSGEIERQKENTSQRSGRLD